VASFLEKLTPLSLAIWFCDDGSLDNGYNYHLHTRGFAEHENNELSLYFKQKWNIETTVKKAYSKRYAKTYYELGFDKENAVKLTDLIKFHMLPSMLYKILNSERDNVIYLAGAMQYHPSGGIKWRRNLKQLLNEKGYYCIDPTKEENTLLLDDGWRETIDSDFPKFQVNFRKIIDNDLYFVKMAGIVVCYYDDFLGGGTFHEIGQSYLLGKKLYLININNKPLNKLSWWALGCCTKIVGSLEELLETLPDITHRPAYQHYHKSKR
jgi:nucleoside 2-deoxyribosyltransferase